MALEATARRRWFGAIVLVVALAMLICGETVLKEKLGNLTFIFYWMVCVGLTTLAIVIAFLDARALQHRIRREQRDLLRPPCRKSSARPSPGRIFEAASGEGDNRRGDQTRGTENAESADESPIRIPGYLVPAQPSKSRAG